MAHRRPLGTTCRTHCRWGGGAPPELGDYLQTPAGTTYLIVGVAETIRADVFNLLLERVADAPADETIHPFAWDARSPKAVPA